jgi:hypothetical protein
LARRFRRAVGVQVREQLHPTPAQKEVQAQLIQEKEESKVAIFNTANILIVLSATTC